ncbi:hypothetical protein ACFVRD_34925 [Streptomyces sp. NPDC057908]|uniref:hypothetical protein n=1 Tax=Streptomyces sp. NPDC057908 TaxID=3346276 RepID=UPI0036E0C3FB
MDRDCLGFLADHVGQTIDHPSPGQKWYTDKPFSYFHMYTRPGEILERLESGWPVRLFVVEPHGETGNWGAGFAPYWLMSHRIRVVEETDAWRAFGHRGAQVLAVIAQLPDLARQWAAQWAADPESSRRTYAAWDERVTDTHALDWWAHYRAEYSRRTVGLKAADQLAEAAAAQAATDAGADTEALTAIRLRARCMVVGQLLHDRIRSGEYEQSIRALLLGAGLDSAPARHCPHHTFPGSRERLTAPRAAPARVVGVVRRTGQPGSEHPPETRTFRMSHRNAAVFAAVLGLGRARSAIGDFWVQNDFCARVMGACDTAPVEYEHPETKTKTSHGTTDGRKACLHHVASVGLLEERAVGALTDVVVSASALRRCGVRHVMRTAAA